MPDSEVAEIQQRLNQAVIAAIRVASEFAAIATQVRVRQLHEAARRGQEAARQARQRTRAAHVADAAVWRAAARPGWWRTATASDIATVWQAAAAWREVDPRAATACRTVVEHLAERGIVDPDTTPNNLSDVAWLSDALDQAAAVAVDEPIGAAVDEPAAGIDTGAAAEERAARRAAAARRQEQMAAHVRAAWPAERAEKVVASEAWPVLAYKLGQLGQAGHDVEALLRAVPAFVDRAHTPAAYAYRVVDDAVRDTVPDSVESSPTAGQRSALRSRTGSVSGLEADAAEIAARGFPTSTRAAIVAARQRSARPAEREAGAARSRGSTHGLDHESAER